MGNRSKEGCDDVTDITLFNSDGDPLCWCGHDSVIELHQASTNTYWYCKKHWQEHLELYKKWLALYELRERQLTRSTFLYPWKETKDA